VNRAARATPDSAGAGARGQNSKDGIQRRYGGERKEQSLKVRRAGGSG
jgi:hypothetical protein